MRLDVTLVDPAEIPDLTERKLVVPRVRDLEMGPIFWEFGILWVARVVTNSLDPTCYLVCGECTNDPTGAIGQRLSFQPHTRSDFRFVDPYRMHLPGTPDHRYVRDVAMMMEIDFEDLFAAALVASLQQANRASQV